MKNTPSTTAPFPALSAEALLEWEGHVESVLRGVAHALNNRAASLSAVMALCTEPDYTPVATRDLLATELERLRDIVNAVRAVGVPKGEVEAFEPVEAATSALGVATMHATLRDLAVSIHSTAPPVRTHRWMLVRALVALMARAAATDPRAAIVLELVERDGWVHFVTRPPPTGSSPCLDELVVGLGGESLGASGFRLPTLATLRRREGR